MDPDVLNKLHQCEIEILDEVVRICDQHNLTYFLVGGSLLGAARHKGFIPWDDDIDIGMLRKDYDEFIKICKRELNSSYYLQCSETYKYFWLVFAKIRKNNTLFIQKDDQFSKDEHRGISIDIFPYDNVINSKNVQRFQRFIINKIGNILYAKQQRHIPIKHLYTNLKKFVYKCFPYFILHFFQKKAMTFCSKNSNCIISWGGLYGDKREMFSIDDFLPVTTLEFESKQYCAPKQWDFYLHQIYDDYMQLPPEDKRISHNPTSISFDTLKEQNT